MDISVVVASRPDTPPEQDLATAVVADRLGYDEVWVGEGWVWDCFALATAIGKATQRVALTVGPVPVSLRDPAMIAVGAASVAALTGRTVGVALGASSVRFVEGMHGRSRSRPGTALVESATAVRSLLDGERTDFQGEVLSTHGYQLRLAPPNGPLTIAAFGERAVRTAAAHADRMVLDLVSTERVVEYRAKLHAAAEEAGRPAPSLAAWLPASVEPDADSAAELTAALAGYLAVPGYGEMFTAAGFGEAVRAAQAGADLPALLDALPADAASRVGLVGDTDDVAARLEAYADAGLDEVVLVPATAGDPGGERTLAAVAEMR
ncbi:LLM class F420-dependent oxidoreductase [Actinomycetes bacterium KLBMP 9759]